MTDDAPLLEVDVDDVEGVATLEFEPVECGWAVETVVESSPGYTGDGPESVAVTARCMTTRPDVLRRLARTLDERADSLEAANADTDTDAAAEADTDSDTETDTVGDTGAEAAPGPDTPLEVVAPEWEDVGATLVARLADAGFETVWELAGTPPELLTDLDGVGPSRAETLVANADRLLDPFNTDTGGDEDDAGDEDDELHEASDTDVTQAIQEVVQDDEPSDDEELDVDTAIDIDDDTLDGELDLDGDDLSTDGSGATPRPSASIDTPDAPEPADADGLPNSPPEDVVADAPDDIEVRLPDGVTPADVRELVDEHTYLGRVASALDLDVEAARAVVFHLDLYEYVCEGTPYGGSGDD